MALGGTPQSSLLCSVGAARGHAPRADVCVLELQDWQASGHGTLLEKPMLVACLWLLNYWECIWGQDLVFFNANVGVETHFFLNKS